MKSLFYAGVMLSVSGISLQAASTKTPYALQRSQAYQSFGNISTASSTAASTASSGSAFSIFKSRSHKLSRDQQMQQLPPTIKDWGCFTGVPGIERLHQSMTKQKPVFIGDRLKRS